jgi:hypothetical protein
MSALDYLMEPAVTCPDTDANDAAFVRAASMIEGRNAVKEFLALFFTLATGIADIINTHGYYDMVIYILKRMPISHPGSVFFNIPKKEGRNEFRSS